MMSNVLKRKLAQMTRKHGYTKTGKILRPDAPYSYAYVHQAQNSGSFTAGRPFWDAVAKYERKPVPKTVTIRYKDTPEDQKRRLKHMQIPPAERPDALDYWLERKDLI